MCRRCSEILDELAKIEGILRVIQHSSGHHVGIVGGEDALASDWEAARQLQHAHWELLTNALHKVQDLQHTPADEEHPGHEGPLGPLPPDLLGQLE